ncbi:FliA/WhiG family RNA polymerase sigma factor [Ruminococcaceae bacterium OttesenSCG-928-L11]|nr:FliA/WhiG family RNA polymerase sigma factor [Ruminococcaceae bacterium OttesenSCG-928-L11]
MAEAVIQESTDKTLDPSVWEEYMQTRDMGLRNDIVMHYSQLVKCIALRMRGTYKNYAQLDDVVNQGIIALIDAVEKYDVSRNIKFETFASIKVKGAIIDYIRAQDWIPRRLRKLSRDLETANNKLCTELGRQPTHQELAKEMNLSLNQLDRVMEQTYSFNLLSYEEVVWQKMSSVGGDEFATDSTEESPERKLMEDELRQQLAASIDALNERERTVISLYYYEKLKLKEIAGILGVSESRVCQIHSAAIVKMKRNMKEYITA